MEQQPLTQRVTRQWSTGQTLMVSCRGTIQRLGKIWTGYLSRGTHVLEMRVVDVT